MTVYVEIIFLSNFCIDAFIFCLVNTVLKVKSSLMRLFFAAALGGLCSAVYPFVLQYANFMKVFLAVILPFIFRKITIIREYIITLSVFLLITFALAGCVLLLNGFSLKNLSFNPITYGLFPILFCSAGLIITLMCGNMILTVLSQRIKNQNYYKVVIENENARVCSVAYYDSGNRVFANNGERVVFVCEDIYNKLMPAKEKTIVVSTLGGKRVVKTIEGKVQIYFGENENKIYHASIGLGNMANIDQKILLHAEMLGGET